MSKRRGHKSKKHEQKQAEPAAPKVESHAPIAAPVQKINWFEVIVPLLIGSGLSVILANNDAQVVVIGSWTGIFISLLWCVFKLWPSLPFAWWKKSTATLIAIFLLGWFAYSDMRERLRPSYPFLHPGVWFTDGRWDLIVNHRGPKTSYSVQILFVDEDRLEFLKRTKKSFDPADLNSYQTTLSIPEVNPKGRGTVFAKQLIWRPFSPEKSHFTTEITWRDGRVHEDIRIARVQDNWFYAMSVSNPETGKHYFDCKDAGFPSPDSLPACFPRITEMD